MASSLASKYARALLDAVGGSGREAAALEELTALQLLLKTHDELHETLSNPALPFNVKRTIIETLAKRLPLSGAVKNFLLVVVANARVGLFPKLVEAYQQVWDERRGVLRGKVSSARELDSDLRRRIESTLRGLTGHEIKLDYDADSELIGGIRLQVGSTIFDGTVRTQLKEMQRRLAGR